MDYHVRAPSEARNAGSRNLAKRVVHYLGISLIEEATNGHTSRTKGRAFADIVAHNPHQGIPFLGNKIQEHSITKHLLWHALDVQVSGQLSVDAIFLPKSQTRGKEREVRDRVEIEFLKRAWNSRLSA